jgi:hypothetical protein
MNIQNKQLDIQENNLQTALPRHKDASGPQLGWMGGIDAAFRSGAVRNSQCAGVGRPSLYGAFQACVG